MLDSVKTFEKPLDKRSYVHVRCETPTTVDGQELIGLCDPGSEVRQAYCCNCKRMDDLSTFEWAETAEPLDQYRRRLKQQIPLATRILGSKLSFAAIIGVGVVTGFGLSKFIADPRFAYGVPIVIAFLLAMGLDAYGKFGVDQPDYRKFI